MDLSPYLANLREDLNTTASAGDEKTKRAAAVLSAALEPAARLAIMNALSDLAAEVTAQLDGQVVDVRLDGRDVRVVVDTRREQSSRASESRSTPPPPPPPPPPPVGGDISRMTLRLFEELKAKAEQAASDQGVSLNTFVQQAVQGALNPKQGWGGPWGGDDRTRDRRRRRFDDEGNGGHSDGDGGDGGDGDDGGDGKDGGDVHGWVRP